MIGPSHSHANHRPRLANMKMARQRGKGKVNPAIPFLNPDPITLLVGQSNEAHIITDWQKVIMLMNSGAQVSSVSSCFCQGPPSRWGAGTRGYWWISHPIPGVWWGQFTDTRYKGLQQGCLATGHTSHKLCCKGTGHGGAKIIDRAMGMIRKGELAKATVTWRQGQFGVVMSGFLQLLHKCAGGWGFRKGAPHSVTPDPTAPKEFHLDAIQGHVHTTWRVTIPLFGTLNVHGKTDVWGHCMWFHGLTELAWGPSYPHLLYQLPHVGSYTQVPPKCQSSWGTWVLTQLWSQPKSLSEKSIQPIRCHW